MRIFRAVLAAIGVVEFHIAIVALAENGSPVRSWTTWKKVLDVPGAQ